MYGSHFELGVWILNGNASELGDAGGALPRLEAVPRSVGRTDSNRTRASSTAWYNVDDDLDHVGDPVVVKGWPF